MPTFTAGPEILVNTTTTGNQWIPTIARLPNGNYVVAWSDDSGLSGDASSESVKAQLFDASGAKIGPELLVNQNIIGRQYDPKIAVLADGNFVVTWTDDTGDADSWAVKARIYDQSGTPVGNEFLVNTKTSTGQWDADVLALSSGGFLVTWADQTGDSSLYGTRGQLFDAGGTKVGSEFLVNTTESLYQNGSSAAALPGGGFVVTWNDFSHMGGDNDRYSIRAQLYDADGNRVGGEFLVNTTTLNDQSRPTVATLADGNFVITWMDNSFLGGDPSGWSIRAQIFTSAGAPVGGEFAVNQQTVGHQDTQEIIALATGGFVIAWQDESGDGSGYAAKARMFDANGVAVGDEFLLNSTTSGNQQWPAIVATDNGFTAAWSDASGANGDASGYGVTMRTFSVVPPPPVTDGETQVNTTTANHQFYPTTTALGDGGFVIAWASYDPLAGVVEIYAQRYDAEGVALGIEFQVNTTTGIFKDYPTITALGDGGFVVAWISYEQDGSGGGVYAQRYDAAGAAVGGEFRINATTAGSQEQPAIASLDEGGFVVTWQSFNQDGSGWGVYAQRYDAAGASLGSEFQVNTTTTDQQIFPAITALGDGGYVVCWMSFNQDGSSYGIYAQRYDAAGVAVGNEFQVNTTTIDQQRDPAITALADGGFVVSWTAASEFALGHTIYAQRYDAAGGPVGGEFQVNSTIADRLEHSTVTALDDGGFVVLWQAENQDGSVWGVYAQRYDAGGAAVGDEIQVNTTTAESQELPAVATLNGGRFVVSWMSYGQDGDGWGIYARLLDAPSVINGTEGDDVLNGTIDQDQINGFGGNDIIAGLQGDDTVDGGGGDDFVHGGAGNDTILGGDGADNLNGNAGNDTLLGGAGADLLNGNPGDDTLDGGDDDDRVSGGPGNDTLYGGAGHDLLRGDNADGLTPGDDYIDAGDGFDRVTYYNTNNGVIVSLLLQGAPQDTGQGWDTLLNTEAISGSVFSDVLIGDDNDNWFTFGGAGIDSRTITSDTISANGGNDLIIAGLGNHNLDGGAGTDTLGFGWIRTEVFGGVTVSLLLQGAAQDTGQGAMTISAFENLSGSGFDDVLTGDAGGNLLAGNAGSDLLIGGAGNDVLLGDGEVNMSPANAGPVTVFNALDYAGVDFYDSDGNIVFLFEGQDLYDGNGNILPREDLLDEFGNPFSRFTLNGITYDFFVVVGAQAISDGFAGNDILDGGDGGDTLIAGAGNDTLIAGSGTDDLDGGTGIDTVSYWGAAGAIDLDLAAGLADEYAADGITYLTTDTLTGIEYAIGSQFDDALIGNAQDNYLDGAGGNDIVQGGGDNDQVLGGGGNDQLSGDFGVAVLTGGGNDLVDGGDGNDSVRGRDGNDTVFGGGGNDFVEGGTGDDYIDGGSGYDRAAFFSMATGGVTVDLNLQGVAQDTGQGWDILVNIEHVSGTAFADVLIGDGGDNFFLAGVGGGSDTVSGNGGNDLVEVGAGNHILSGGSGIDTWSLFGNSTDISAAGVTVSLALQGGPQDSEQGMMTATGFENLSGSLHGDSLTGNDMANILLGDGGSDLLSGGEGNDTLYGDGRMWLDFQGGGSSGAITLLGDSSLIQLLPGVAGNDTLLGGKGDDILHGGRGNDVMTGGAGSDQFVIEAQSGADRIAGFAHVDTIVFAASSGVDDFNDLVFTAVGKDTLISWGTGDSLLIEGFKPKELSVADFQFEGGLFAANALTADSTEQLQDWSGRAFAADLFLF